MTIDKNTFIEILGLPEWDAKVLNVLEYLELERAFLKQGEMDCFRKSTKYGIVMLFDDTCNTAKQIEMEDSGNLYLNQISFDKDTPFSLPFTLTMKDDYDIVITKIGRAPDKKSRGSNTSFSWEFEREDKNIQFVCDFKNDNLTSLKEFWMRPY